MIDYYAILGVPRTATAIEIRDAYLSLARDTHPDKVKDPVARKKAEDAFKYVTAAYDTLSKERSRREYSARLPAVTGAKDPAPAKSSPPVVQGPPLTPREKTLPPTTTEGKNTGAIPSSGRVHFDALGEGIEAFKKKDYHTAVQLLNMAVTQDENSSKAHAMLSMALAKNPNWVRDALNHMETASRLEPKNVSYLVDLAILLHSQGLRLRSKRTLESAIALNPNHPDVARALKEIPTGPGDGEPPSRTTSETPRGLFDRLRKR